MSEYPKWESKMNQVFSNQYHQGDVLDQDGEKDQEKDAAKRGDE